MSNQKRRLYTCIIFCISIVSSLTAHPTQEYRYPESPEVLETLKEWQDLKFGLFIHWGTYSQWGIVESWSLLPEPIELCYGPRPDSLSYFEYKKAYEGLKNTFNPQKFDARKWAAAAKEAGMKYVVFTTKHHDGFNMFDTKASDYKITDKECPFSSSEKADIFAEVSKAFRENGFMVGAYYSVPDWHSNDYWWDKFPPLGKGINYPADKFPERLERFHDFVDTQLNELTCGNYGKIDIVWFDLCYAEPTMPWDRYARTIRENQPGAMIVTRHTGTIYENYRTPEQTVPDKALDYPWESCITMGTSWSYKPDDRYKSPKQLISLLVKIVSRGGNLLLNVGPDSNGELAPEMLDRLSFIGKWMNIHSEGIYGSRTFAPYSEGNFFFTQKDNGIYAYCISDGDEVNVPEKVILKSVDSKLFKAVRILGTNRNLKYKVTDNGIEITIPKTVSSSIAADGIWCLKFSK